MEGNKHSRLPAAKSVSAGFEPGTSAWKLGVEARHLINFALLLLQPRLTKDAANKISKSYSELRDQENVGNETAKVIYLRLCYFVISNFGYKRWQVDTVFVSQQSSLTFICVWKCPASINSRDQISQQLELNELKKKRGTVSSNLLFDRWVVLGPRI